MQLAQVSRSITWGFKLQTFRVQCRFVGGQWGQRIAQTAARTIWFAFCNLADYSVLGNLSLIQKPSDWLINNRRLTFSEELNPFLSRCFVENLFSHDRKVENNRMGRILTTRVQVWRRQKECICGEQLKAFAHTFEVSFCVDSALLDCFWFSLNFLLKLESVKNNLEHFENLRKVYKNLLERFNKLWKDRWFSGKFYKFYQRNSLHNTPWSYAQ